MLGGMQFVIFTCNIKNKVKVLNQSKRVVSGKKLYIFFFVFHGKITNCIPPSMSHSSEKVSLHPQQWYKYAVQKRWNQLSIQQPREELNKPNVQTDKIHSINLRLKINSQLTKIQLNIKAGKTNEQNTTTIFESNEIEVMINLRKFESKASLKYKSKYAGNE